MTPTSDWSDEQIIEWFNTQKDGYNLRGKTAKLWVAVLRSFFEVGRHQTVRGIYYKLIKMGVVGKSDADLRKVEDQVLAMRWQNCLPFDWIVDNTRAVSQPITFDGTGDFLGYGELTFRAPLWDNKKEAVYIWLEKDTLAGIVGEITDKYDVPLMVTRGHSSDTFVRDAALRMVDERKWTYCYFLADYDDHGRNIVRKVVSKLEYFGADAFIHAEIITILPEHIDFYDLPTRKAKKPSPNKEPEIKWATELDALEPATIQQLVEQYILRHVTKEELDENERISQQGRDALRTLRENLGRATNLDNQSQ